MQVIEYIDLFAGALISTLLCAIVIKIIFKLKLNQNSFERYIFLILTSMFVCIINIYNKDIFKVLITIPFITIGMKYIFNIKLEKSFLCVIIATFYMFIGEIIIGVILSFLPLDYSFVFNNIFGKSFGGAAVTIATIPLLYIKVLRNLIVERVEKIGNKKMFLQGAFLLVAIGAFAYKNGQGIQNILALLMNVLIFLIFLIILYLLYKEERKAEQFSQNYNVLLSYLEKYEEALEEKSKIVHDFKNQLIVISGYANPSNRKLKNYIAEIIEDQKNIDSNLLIRNIDKLPRGLKGLVYYKFSQLNNSIDIDIDTRGNLNKINKIPPKLNKDMLKVIGILIDNSIEGAIESENKRISLGLKIENNELVMELENSKKNQIDNTKIMASGFSTKGKGRGYGLAIINDIVKNNWQFKFSINIKEDLFIAILRVKI